MAGPNLLEPSLLTLAVSSPGAGVARHYRLQFQRDAADHWHMYGSYPSRLQAEECLKGLSDRVYRARLVPFNLCPAAA